MIKLICIEPKEDPKEDYPLFELHKIYDAEIEFRDVKVTTSKIPKFYKDCKCYIFGQISVPHFNIKGLIPLSEFREERINKILDEV